MLGECHPTSPFCEPGSSRSVAHEAAVGHGLRPPAAPPHPRRCPTGIAAAQARKEAYLASLILQDVEKRGEAVRERGVTAWAHRPREREQVNERFLRNTLRGVDSSNRRVEQQAVRSGSPAPGAGGAKRVRPEDVVVDHGRGGAGSTRRGSEGTSSSSSSAAASSSDSEPDAKPSAGNGKGGMRDDELAEFLSRPRVKRGRGAVGSRADEPGPFLPGGGAEHKVGGYSLVLADEETRRNDARIAAMRDKAKRKERKKAEKREKKERKRERKEGRSEKKKRRR